MIARDIMTPDVISIGPDTPVPEIARQLLTHHISAVPVVDEQGAVAGMVSEGDLMRRAEMGTERRRSWWLTVLLEAEDLAREFVKAHGQHARNVMSSPVVAVTEDTPVPAVAKLLEERRIKRVPVLRDGRLVGIVSRADLLRGLAVLAVGESQPPRVDDQAIRERLLTELRAQPWAMPARLTVVVRDGVVHLWGVISSDEERDALAVAARTVPGVRAVEEHLVKIPRWAGAE